MKRIREEKSQRQIVFLMQFSYMQQLWNVCVWWKNFLALLIIVFLSCVIMRFLLHTRSRRGGGGYKHFLGEERVRFKKNKSVADAKSGKLHYRRVSESQKSYQLSIKSNNLYSLFVWEALNVF